MHEQSLAKNLLLQADAIRREHHASRITEIRVEIGPLSGVEPPLLTSAFYRLSSDDPFCDAVLAIDQVDLVGQCRDCNEEFLIQDFNFCCPKCSGNIRVTRGDELHLVSVSLESDEMAMR